MITLDKKSGKIKQAIFIASPNCDARPDPDDISLLVIHNISLPPNQFGGEGIIQCFTNTLDPEEHSYYQEISNLRVSSHFLIRRDGELLQFVSVQDRAWHAGKSEFQGRSRCNDFSIGIELEGADDIAYEEQQYHVLNQLTQTLLLAYPSINPTRIVGHSDIAPGRKTDPGPSFDWVRFRAALKEA